jgi:hypothetical protein
MESSGRRTTATGTIYAASALICAIDRRMLMTVAGLTLNRRAVGLTPPPEVTDA